VRERRLCDAGRDRGDTEAPRIQGGERDLHAGTLLADELCGRDPGTVEDHLGGDVAGQAHLLLRGAEGHARRVARHHERGEAALGVVGGAGEQDVVVRARAVADPLLGAVDDVLVTLADGPGPDSAHVGAGLGLGEAVRAEPVAAEHPRQPLGAQGVVAVAGDDVGGQAVHAHADTDAGPGGRDLLDHLQVGLVGLGAAAVLLGEGEGQQPRPPEQPVRRLRELGALLGVVHLGCELLGGDLTGQLEQGGPDPVVVVRQQPLHRGPHLADDATR
jgi:hypothetical protein